MEVPGESPWRLLVRGIRLKLFNQFSGLAGCFDCGLCRVSLLGRMNVSSLAASRTATRMSPSSSFSRISFQLSFLGGENGLILPTGSVYSRLLKAAICWWRDYGGCRPCCNIRPEDTYRRRTKLSPKTTR